MNTVEYGLERKIGKIVYIGKRFEYVDQIVKDVRCVGYAELNVKLKIGMLSEPHQTDQKANCKKNYRCCFF